MSIERKRWAQRAQELRFHQLDSVRLQAEGWRTGLGGLTALLTAVLIVKGRDNISTLAPAFRWTVVLLLGVALALLVGATLLAVRAAAGAPGDDILLSGEHLKAWTRDEVRRVSRVLRRAMVLATAGVACVALAVGFTWLGPDAKPEKPVVTVEHGAGKACGRLVRADARRLTLELNAPKRTVHVPLASLLSMKPASKCG